MSFVCKYVCRRLVAVSQYLGIQRFTDTTVHCVVVAYLCLRVCFRQRPCGSCFESSPLRSMSYVVFDLGVIAGLLYAMLQLQSHPYFWYAYPVYAFLQGTMMWAVFVLGHGTCVNLSTCPNSYFLPVLSSSSSFGFSHFPRIFPRPQIAAIVPSLSTTCSMTLSAPSCTPRYVCRFTHGSCRIVIIT